MYTVFNIEGDGEFDDPETGLTLREAAHAKLKRNGYSYDVQRIGDLMVLFMEMRHTFPLSDSPLAPTELRSEATDDQAACEDIMQQVISGGAPIGGPHTVVTDADYQREMTRLTTRASV